MRVFMLGWEFPPYISGGLGTACYGLTKALGRHGVQITFVLPRSVAAQETSHVRLLSCRDPGMFVDGPGTQFGLVSPRRGRKSGVGGFEQVSFKVVPTQHLYSPYQSTGGRLRGGGVGQQAVGVGLPWSTGAAASPADLAAAAMSEKVYEGDVIAESRRYAQLCVELARQERFDVIHAHDWMTFPAGLAVAAATSRPLVVHVHSTEFDRAGEQVHQDVYDIERRGMHGAMRVIAVSYLTKSIIQHRYGVDAGKIDVVYNGIDNNGRTPQPMPARASIKKTDKVVLFLGRVTMQKGPEYFIQAAKKVLEKNDQVKFVIAGSGDKVQSIMDMATEHGISQKVLFTGFLRGRDVERVFKMADVFVMPSVSEPFGIAPLEAISHDVPVIISKTSGVSEVLSHALKVDFWDINEIANKILAVLKHPPLSSTLREHADVEIRRLTWDGAASRCKGVYEAAVSGMVR